MKKGTEVAGIEFPADPPKKISKLTDTEISERLAAHRRAVEEVKTLDASQVVSTGQSDAVVDGMKSSVAAIERLSGEQRKRAAAAEERATNDRLERHVLSLGRRRFGSSGEQHEAMLREQEEAKAAREAQRADLTRRRAEEARQRRAELVKAGVIYEPIGTWDTDGSDALSAFLNHPTTWEMTDKRAPEGVVLDVFDFTLAYTVLALLAENDGELKTRIDRFPRLMDGWHGDIGKRLNHLAANDILVIERKGVDATIRRGPRVEDLRRSFAEQMLLRAEEERSRS